MGLDYKSSGVDVEAGYKSVELMKKDVKSTFRPEVLTDLGGFGGLFALNSKKYEEPVLVSGTDGVGTKLKLAFLMDKHDTIGIDGVAMCVNDIVCSGAEPLFFLDYLAQSKNVPEKVASIVKGIADGCKMAGCSLVGGETAEMPGFYSDGEYDMAGFAVGIVDKPKIINGSTIKKGDVVIGIASSGIHSNGYSLVRKIFEPLEENLDKYTDRLGCTLGEELLKPTKIYVKTILELKEKVNIKGIANITGGGFFENIPRVFPKGLGANIKIDSYEVPEIFKLMQEVGNIDKKIMYNTFNMGVGMIVVVSKEDVDATIIELEKLGEKAYAIGEMVEGEGVTLC